MQSLIHQLHGALGGNPGLIIGYILLGLLTLHAAAICFGTLRRVYAGREQRALAREHLKLQIKAAKFQHQELEQARQVWNGYRKFQVAKKVRECADVESFYLAPHDGRPLPAFKPGQYITFHLNVPGESKPIIRCYSLSDSPSHPDYYRVTIKKALPPPEVTDAKPGRASCFFCESVKVGDILDVKAPNGHFFLDMTDEKPVVLISGGVGVTPMVSMLNAIIASGQKRELWFFFGARNGADHIFKDYMTEVAAKYDFVRMHICYSRPRPGDVKGKDYQHEGRVSVDLMKELLPSNNYDYFICGPGPFMKNITDGLEFWGVPDKHVHFEAFGPATVKKATPAPTPHETDVLSKVEITFSRAGKKLRWNPTVGSLLELAEENGIKIDAGCRAGNCGTCLVAIKSGEVGYLAGQGGGVEAGSCLTCVCKPKSDLVLDA